jgi:hypothetical protein
MGPKDKKTNQNRYGCTVSENSTIQTIKYAYLDFKAGFLSDAEWLFSEVQTPEPCSVVLLLQGGIFSPFSFFLAA